MSPIMADRCTLNALEKPRIFWMVHSEGPDWLFVISISVCKSSDWLKTKSVRRECGV